MSVMHAWMRVYIDIYANAIIPLTDSQCGHENRLGNKPSPLRLSSQRINELSNAQLITDITV